MGINLRLLYVEDSENDAGLIIHQLCKAGYIVDYKRVDTPVLMRAAFLKHSWDLIFSDYKLKHFGATEALAICQELSPDVPFIVITNGQSDENIVAAIKAGAHDYLTKDNLARLIPAIERELNETKIRRVKRLAVNALSDSEKQYRTLFSETMEGFALYEIIYDKVGKPVDYRFIILNPAFEQVTGLSAAGLIGRTVKEVFPGIQDSWIDRYGKVALTAVPVRFDDYSKALDRHFEVVAYCPKNGQFATIVTDITERKRAVELLQQSKSRLIRGESVSKSGNWELHLSSGKITASEGACKLYGIEGERWNIEVIKDIALPEYRAKLDTSLSQLVNDGVPYDVEFKIRQKISGQILDIHSIAEYDSREGILFGVINDISERKKTEGKLLRSERTLSNLISNLPGFVYRCKNDTDWTMEYLSEGFTAITGYSVDEIMKFKKLNYTDIIHPDYRNYLWEQWQVLLELKSPLEEEYPIITKSGETKWVWERGRGIYNDDNNLLYLEGFISDITERKRTEQIQKVLYDISTAVLTTRNLGELVEIIRNQLGTLLDTSNFYVAFYDEDNDMFYTPRAVDQLDNLESWPAEKSMTGYLIKQKKALLVSAEDVRKLVDSGEITMVGSPSELWLGVPLHEDEKIIGAFVVQSYDNPNAYTLKDVEMLEFISHQISLFVQRKRAEGEIKAALAKAEESDRLKSAFLATMNHELRTPLNHILGFSELILSEVMPEDNQSFASSIYSSGKNLLSIVEDVFDLALAEQTNVKVRLQTFRLMDQFMENKSSFDHILQCSGKAEQIQLIFKPDTRLLAMYLTVDRSKVNQILINLFKNAVKFTNIGTIEFGYQSNEPGKLTFFIKDTGIGIPKEKQEVIFDFFRQVDDSRTRMYGGIGIGLAISQKISNILKGKLSVISEPEKGSAFYLTVPVELADVSDPL